MSLSDSFPIIGTHSSSKKYRGKFQIWVAIIDGTRLQIAILVTNRQSPSFGKKWGMQEVVPNLCQERFSKERGTAPMGKRLIRAHASIDLMQKVVWKNLHTHTRNNSGQLCIRGTNEAHVKAIRDPISWRGRLFSHGQIKGKKPF